jgi:hypothetical protein
LSLQVTSGILVCISCAATGNWNPSSFSIEEIFKATVVVLELAVLEQRAQILGGICIFDLGGISLQHAWHVTPSIAKRTVELLVVSSIPVIFPSSGDSISCQA